MPHALLSLVLSGVAACGVVALSQEPRPQNEAAEQQENSIGMSFVLLPPGEFQMGPSGGETKRVQIEEAFYIGAFEVTRSTFERVMKSEETGNVLTYRFKNEEGDTVTPLDRHPAIYVTYEMAQTFCEKLSNLPAEKRAGRSYRLPEHQEWEYACRAGTDTRFHTGDEITTKDACFGKPWNGGGPVEVGSYAPNAWGLYDMHGNAQEYVAGLTQRGAEGSVYFETKTVGGGWRAEMKRMGAGRLNDRGPGPDSAGWSQGFRVVMEQKKPGR